MRVACLALALAIASACAAPKAPRVRPDEVPADPIAFIFLESEKARDLAERLREARGEVASKPGVAKLDRLQRLLAGDEDVNVGMLGQPSLLDPRGETRTHLDALPPGATPLEFSADRRRLLFSSARFDHLQISELDLATGEVRVLTQGNADHPSATRAPDGRLVYVESISPPGVRDKLESRLFLTNASGGEARPLTPGPSDGSPRFSPDGSALVYETRDAAGRPAIALLQPLEGTPKLVARGREPVFSPDGQWIVYSHALAVGHRLWRMLPDGSGKLAIGEAPPETGDERHPTVSPDGRYVVYVADLEGRHFLRIRRMDGGGDRQLFDEGDGLAPVW